MRVRIIAAALHTPQLCMEPSPTYCLERVRRLLAHGDLASIKRHVSAGSQWNNPSSGMACKACSPRALPEPGVRIYV